MDRIPLAPSSLKESVIFTLDRRREILVLLIVAIWVHSAKNDIVGTELELLVISRVIPIARGPEIESAANPRERGRNRQSNDDGQISDDHKDPK